MVEALCLLLLTSCLDTAQEIDRTAPSEVAQAAPNETPTSGEIVPSER